MANFAVIIYALIALGIIVSISDFIYRKTCLPVLLIADCILAFGFFLFVLSIP